jgi:hypothetical protein
METFPLLLPMLKRKLIGWVLSLDQFNKIEGGGQKETDQRYLCQIGSQM